MLGEDGLQLLGGLAPARERVRVAVEHRQAGRCEKFRHLGVHAGDGAHPGPRIDSEVDEPRQPLRRIGIGSDDRASLADRKRLRRMEREDLHVALAAERPPPSSRAPNPAAESISSGSPWAATVSRHRARALDGGALPNVEHASTPATVPRWSCRADCSASGSSCHASSSMSTNSGSNPAQRIAHAVAANVKAGTAINRRAPAGSRTRPAEPPSGQGCSCRPG